MPEVHPSRRARPATHRAGKVVLATALATATALALALATPAASAQAHTPPPGPVHVAAPTTDAVSPEEAERWREDLATLVHGIVALHGNAFHTVSREELEAEAARLRERIPLMARHEIVVAFTRIGAMIGDGHTGVSTLFDPAVGFHPIPARLGWYTDGLWVEAADRELAGLLGARIVAIGGVPVEEAVDRVTPLIARDNDIWLRVMAPLYLARTEVLHALGLSDDPMVARLTVEGGPDGGRRTVEVAALARPLALEHGVGRLIELTDDWVDARAPGETPVWLRHTDRTYWWTRLDESNAVYFQYNQVADAPHGPPVREAIARALALGDSTGAAAFILDLRNNSGGEGMLNRDVVLQLLRSRYNEHGRLLVLTGARTFSAAQLLVHQLDEWTDAVFIGEPTGSSPRFYGDHRFFRLPNSEILVSAAPTWWQPGGPYDRRPFRAPDLAAEPAFEDYRLNRDPSVAAAVGWDERVTLDDVLAAAIEREPEAAAEAVRAWAHDPAQRYTTAETAINAAAYRLVRRAGWAEALPVFRLNVEIHPGYANGWDSLGEALLALGRTDEGLEAYGRAHALDPSVGRAAAVLRAHGRLPPPGG